MNIELLEEVKAHVLAEPRRVNMGDWIQSFKDVNEDAQGPGSGIPDCGMICCVGGWARVLSKMPLPELAHKLTLHLFRQDVYSSDELKDREECTLRELEDPYYQVVYTAAIVLDLSTSQAHRLFFQGSWPSKLLFKLRACKPGSPEYAAVVGERIDFFILHNGDY